MTKVDGFLMYFTKITSFILCALVVINIYFKREASINDYMPETNSYFKIKQNLAKSLYYF